MSRIAKAAAVLAGTGAVALGGAGLAVADSGAAAAAVGSPGVVSGNAAQVPVHVPVNACGNTVNVIGALNPAFGNTCVNSDDNGADADAVAAGSPGVGSGNVGQVPVHVPVNLCGNTGSLIGVLNPAFGNTCVNGGGSGRDGGVEMPGNGGEGPGAGLPGFPGTGLPGLPGTGGEGPGDGGDHGDGGYGG
ncbi:chaplin [Streptomyces sp. CC208A]|uniref:chaplin n=1 Tax=Streptomyces sp. CC208A TaxID=3044573 RepID=UPI0024A96334|nr:chaplin [Streptomyces sp. CC208A]